MFLYEWSVGKLKRSTRSVEHLGTFFGPDGLRVDVDGGDALQQELNHLQERVGGLFGERQLPCDLPLQTQNTVNTDVHGSGL